LQGGIFCHPNAESDLGLSLQAEGRAPEACRVCTWSLAASMGSAQQKLAVGKIALAKNFDFGTTI
jgi:hypothetical protein